jgi:hypothetical protein
MTDNEWQAHLTREAAKAIGTWLEGKGDRALQRPICSLTMADLEAMAINAIGRWIVLQSERLKRDGWPREDPVTRILLG